MKIAILVPFYRQISTISCKCLIDLACLLPSYGHEFAFISIDNTYLHMAREGLYEQFERQFGDKGYDWILHIDSDQDFHITDVMKLIRDAEENNFPILSGVYFGRTAEQVTPILLKTLTPEIRKEMAEMQHCKVEDLKGQYYRLATIPDDRFFEVDVIGFGFFICRPQVYKDIVEKFGRPVFPIKFNKLNNRTIGEDSIWCERAKRCGYTIMVDREVIVGHVGGETGLRDHKAWLAERWLAREKENEAFHKEGNDGKNIQ
jgi:hypothetical protein